VRGKTERLALANFCRRGRSVRATRPSIPAPHTVCC